jgi:butyrate kinase
VIITGGIAYSQFITGRVIARVRFIAPVELAPGEEELQSLALGGLRVLRGEEQPKTYLG